VTFVELARRHGGATSPAALVSYLFDLANGAEDAQAIATDDNAVKVTTWHAAKGLEWPIVVIAGVEKGLVPHASATSAAARAEEVRLLHVAVTRAEHALHLTWSRRRGGTARLPSPLLATLTIGTDTPAPPPVHLVARMVREDPSLDALRAWRRAAAIAADVPETMVCSDRALAAVAHARPASIDELAALPEIGPIAARRLGPRLLAALAAELS
jgi:DNA helicase-2/ATP-dependent DNA helicase PcrA